MNPWLWLLIVPGVLWWALLLLCGFGWWLAARERRREHVEPRAACRCGAQDEHDHAPACLPDAFADIANRTRINVDPRLPDLYLIPNEEN